MSSKTRFAILLFPSLRSTLPLFSLTTFYWHVWKVCIKNAYRFFWNILSEILLPSVVSIPITSSLYCRVYIQFSWLWKCSVGHSKKNSIREFVVPRLFSRIMSFVYQKVPLTQVGLPIIVLVSCTLIKLFIFS